MKRKVWAFLLRTGRNTSRSGVLVQADAEKPAMTQHGATGAHRSQRFSGSFLAIKNAGRSDRIATPATAMKTGYQLPDCSQRTTPQKPFKKTKSGCIHHGNSWY
ncbi:MAG: hypothetical protein HQL87_16210 [Magnetococcales bacterium]|nr:hypothetical protein [Magnetococcales bacterium]